MTAITHCTTRPPTCEAPAPVEPALTLALVEATQLRQHVARLREERDMWREEAQRYRAERDAIRLKLWDTRDELYQSWDKIEALQVALGAAQHTTLVTIAPAPAPVELEPLEALPEAHEVDPYMVFFDRYEVVSEPFPIGAKVRIVGPAYHNALGVIVPRTDYPRLNQRDDLRRVQLEGYTCDGNEPVILVALSELEERSAFRQGGR